MSDKDHLTAFDHNGIDVKIDMEKREEVTLSFHDIRYEVRKKVDDKPVCGKTAMQEILCGVSGWMPPGLNAIMGPTGSGKTSLLDVLAKRKDPRGLIDGVVLLNGERQPADFRLMSGYVVQDDVVMGTLTVRENLAFSANLRLSHQYYGKEARKQKVDEVIEKLGLHSCADTLIGNEFIRGVSGGERKRVNIGMEMILDPPVLFLDEPTTGLDANTANSLVLLLYKLASDGRNIVISIHQPRYSIFSLFDRLIILHQGNIVYRGPAKTAVDYFTDIGFVCPTFHNPADFFLDVVGGDVNTAMLIGKMNASSAVEPTTSKNQVTAGDKRVEVLKSDEIAVAMQEDEFTDNSEFLLKAFDRSSLAREECDKLQAIKAKDTACLDETNVKVPQTSYANGFFTQLDAVFRRTVLNTLRNPMVTAIQTFITVIFAALMGLIYFQVDTTVPNGIQNRTGCYFFLITSQVMSNLSALQIFIKNRAHFVHESASGYYRASVYFIAQVCGDLIPNRIIPLTYYCAIIYFMIGFQTDVGKFFFFYLTMFMTTLGAVSVTFFVSASVKLFAVANILVSLPFVFMMLFGGFLVNTGSILDWLEWIKYVSIFRYGINALIVNEMTGMIFINNASYPGFNASSSSPCISTITHSLIPNCTTGETYMDQQGITYGVWGLWQNILALAAIALGFLLLAYIQLRRVNKYK